MLIKSSFKSTFCSLLLLFVCTGNANATLVWANDIVWPTPSFTWTGNYSSAEGASDNFCQTWGIEVAGTDFTLTTYYAHSEIYYSNGTVFAFGCHAEGVQTTEPFSQNTWHSIAHFMLISKDVVVPPTVAITASPASVSYGGYSTLSWSSTNATSCTASGGWSGSISLSGSQAVGPLSSTTSYSISCAGGDGGASSSTVVSVAPPPLIPQLTSIDPKELGLCKKDIVGNPIRAGVGNKFQTETDYTGAGPAPLAFTRYYNSHDSVVTGQIGAKWRHTYSSNLTIVDSTTTIVSRQDGSAYIFTLQGSVWKSDGFVTLQLQQNAGGWIVTTENDSVEQYNGSGVLQSKTTRAGLTTTLSYTGSELTSVTDPFGRSLVFVYVNGLIDTITDPAGGIFKYNYNADGYGAQNLTNVTYPDNSSRVYIYFAKFEDFPNNINYVFPNALKTVIDENGKVYARWTYDQQGRAVSSINGDGLATFANSTALIFDDVNNTTMVSDGLGNSRVYHFIKQDGLTKVSQIVGDPCISCGGLATQTIYDANGFVQSQTDFNSNVTNFNYNARGLLESKTDAVAMADARTISTTWHASLHVPLCREETLRTTLMDYDISGRLTKRIEIDTTDSADFPDSSSKNCTNVQANRATQLNNWNTRIWDYSYYTTGVIAGLLQSVNGPLPVDANSQDDITTYIYNATFGNLVEIQRAYNQNTQITTHDAHGRPTAIIDSNGLTTKLTYTVRGWLDLMETGSVASGFQTTDYTYDNAGQLSSILFPNGEAVFYVYDTAHRLTDIYDQPNNQGNHIHYSLDGLGNRLQTTISDPTGSLKRKQTQVFNTANRLTQIKDAASNIVQSLTYDNNGNVLTTNDSANTTTNSYDALNRLKAVTDASAGVTTYQYDAHDHLISVTDPKGATANPVYATTYSYDGLDNLKQTASSDTGSTSYQYDKAGNVTSKTDARGITTTYSYDALGRLLGISYPNDPATNFTYDACTNGAGRLCQVSDSSGTTSWSYDLFGRVVQKTQIIGSVILSLDYNYNALTGKLDSLTYPSGTMVSFTYNSGDVSSITSSKGGIMQSMVYDPFGPLSSWNWGNNQAMQRNYDQDGRLSSYTRGNSTFGMSYNLTGTVSDILDQSNAVNNQSFNYDALLRLTNYNSVSRTYGYDSNGNRANTSIAGTTTTNTIDPLSNILKKVGATNYSYDSVGNLLNNGAHSFAYDERNRMNAIDAGTADQINYLINGLGQRVAKQGSQAPLQGDLNIDGQVNRDDVYALVSQLLSRSMVAGDADCNGDSVVNSKDILCVNTQTVASVTEKLASARVYFVYGEHGRVVGEYDQAGNPIQETIWFNDQPVATIKGPNIYYIHSDHLNTPRAITDNNNKVVWRWDSDPFGTTPANEDPDGDGTSFTYNLRFPGQYYDQESGLHYNYFRDYDPSTGRYITSDPIGLVAGLNTYAYVGNNPLYWIDPFGLEVQICSRPAQILNGLVDHYWVITDTVNIGLQGDPNVIPGDQYEGIGTPTFPTDHSKDTPTSCEVQNNVNELCVNAILSEALGQPQGGFGPTSNCKQFAFSVVNKCRTGPQIVPSQ